MRVIVMESPQYAEKIARCVSLKWPGEVLILLVCHSYILTDMCLPHDTPYADYPVIGEPKLRPFLKRNGSERSFFRGFRVGADNLLERLSLSFAETKGLLNRVDNIMCVSHGGHSGALGFVSLLQMMSADLLDKPCELIMMESGTDMESVERDFSKLLYTDNERFSTLVNAGRVKQYFDYNWAVNSVAILGHLYRKVMHTSDPVFISKNALQVFFYIDEKKTITEFWMEAAMAPRFWRGTGDFEGYESQYLFGLGSPASRDRILEQMHSMGLISLEAFATINIEQAGLHSLETKHYALTEAGLKFHAELHESARDHNLPFRLDQWMRMPLNEAVPEINTYLKRFFGEQKRFQEC
jgi:hypothetical protein